MALHLSSIRLLARPHASRYILRLGISSSTNSGAGDHKVVVSKNGSTIVCWHPEPAFPYECSKPLPAPKTSVADQSALRNPYTDTLDSSLKGVQRYKHMFVRRSDKQIREELMKLTHTNKHIWFPHKGIKYRKKNPPKDRDFL